MYKFEYKGLPNESETVDSASAFQEAEICASGIKVH